MANNIKRKVSVKTIVANVIRNLRLKQLHDYSSFYEWALEAELKIQSKDTFERKECILTLANHRARLPRDFVTLISLKIGDSFPEYTNRDFKLWHQADSNLALRRDINLDSNNTKNFDLSDTVLDLDIRNQPVKFSLDNGFMSFPNKKDGDVGIAYWALPIDKDGLPQILAEHMDAVEQYCMWKWKTADYVNGDIPRHVYKELEQRWYYLCGQARGDSDLPDQKEMEYIANRIWNQLLPVNTQNLF